MVKSELITRLKESHPHLPAKDVEGMVSRLFDLVTEALANGERVETAGFGHFSPGLQSSPQNGRPPDRSGARFAFPQYVLFKPGVWFKANRSD